ncbi:MAG: hypothetical protein L6Q71_07560 [Planctomycetes bacterium]|nr:hypothetical protein [Planctomycetota bacterium]NUQ33735.1 hypothetical protein [Planctomycetaceae bacterium]
MKDLTLGQLANVHGGAGHYIRDPENLDYGWVIRRDGTLMDYQFLGV